MKIKLVLGGILLVVLGVISGFYASTSPVVQTIPEKDSTVEDISFSKLVPVKTFNQSESKAKNVILLIGDGMSISQITGYRILKGGPNSRIAMDKFPYTGIVLTHSHDAPITDSASSATAYSTGSKTNNRYLGMDSDKNYLENLTEKLDQHGFVSSLIATSEISHATPAAFVAHVESRWNTDEISSQIFDSNVAVLLGGGRKIFLPESLGGVRKDNRNLLEEIKSSELLVTTKNELNEFNMDQPGRVFGLFSDDHLRDIETPDNHSKEPSLSNMLQFAIDRSAYYQGKGCKGFFIMAEGSQVDWAGHVNNLDYLRREMEDLDGAVALALEHAIQSKDTLVIVTADHETGGLLLESDGIYTKDSIKFSFNTAIGQGNHTGVPVPVYAYGPGAENFTGTLDNTDIYRAILASLEISSSSGSCIKY